MAPATYMDQLLSFSKQFASQIPPYIKKKIFKQMDKQLLESVQVYLNECKQGYMHKMVK